MILKNEDELDSYIICHKCYTLHKKVSLKRNSKACCNECGGVLYAHDEKLLKHGLPLSITGLIFFIIANIFPLVKIELLGHQQFLTIPKTFLSLFESGFIIVGVICLFLIFIFPLMIFTINITLFTLLKFRRGDEYTKRLLILLAHIKPWSMSDIFLISILISLVKLIGYVHIDMGISFWALIIFVLLDLYITKKIHISDIWVLREKIFR